MWSSDPDDRLLTFNFMNLSVFYYVCHYLRNAIFLYSSLARCESNLNWLDLMWTIILMETLHFNYILNIYHVNECLKFILHFFFSYSAQYSGKIFVAKDFFSVFWVHCRCVFISVIKLMFSLIFVWKICSSIITFKHYTPSRPMTWYTFFVNFFKCAIHFSKNQLLAHLCSFPPQPAL